jgi:hypothetical protein
LVSSKIVFMMLLAKAKTITLLNNDYCTTMMNLCNEE